MRDRVLSILFFGSLFWLAFVFLFYAGIFVNYIEAHSIPIFYNQFFADSQAWWLWVPGVLLFGAVFMTDGRVRFKMLFFATAFLLALVPWYPKAGEKIGKALFSKEHVTYRFKRIVVKDATLLFSSRGYDYVVVPGKSFTLRYPTANRVEEGS